MLIIVEPTYFRVVFCVWLTGPKYEIKQRSDAQTLSLLLQAQNARGKTQINIKQMYAFTNFQDFPRNCGRKNFEFFFTKIRPYFFF